jgi:hypothetical protein
MSTPNGGSGDQWAQPGDPTRPVPSSPPPPPSGPSGYGTPSSPSYGKYGQGEPLPPTAPQPYGSPPASQSPWGQAPGQWGQPQYANQQWQNGPGAFQAAGGLGTAVTVLSGLLTVGYWISALLSPSADREYEAAAANGRSAADVFTTYDSIDLFTLPVLIAAWVVTCVWLGRARENALRLNPDGQRRSAVWVWLSWLIPIVSLWFPKQILDDTIKSTAPAAGVREPISTGWYWAAWIAMNLLSNLGFALSSRAELGDKVMPALDFGVAIAATAALVLWVLLVRRISAVQDRLAASGPVSPAEW